MFQTYLLDISGYIGPIACLESLMKMCHYVRQLNPMIVAPSQPINEGVRGANRQHPPRFFVPDEIRPGAVACGQNR